MLTTTPRTFLGSTTFTVTGLTGSDSQRVVTEVIAAVDGVGAVNVELPTGTVTVTVQRPVDRADIATALDGTGHLLVP